MPGSPMSSSIRSTGCCLQLVQRFGAVAGLVGAVSGGLKQRRDGVAQRTVVVNDQHDAGRQSWLSCVSLRHSPQGPTTRGMEWL